MYRPLARLLACLLVVSAASAADLLANGDFADGLAGWWVAEANVKTNLVAVDVGGAKRALHLDLAPPAGANPWDIAATHPLAGALEPRRLYRLTLWLKGPADGKVSVLVQLAHDPWSTLFAEDVTLTAEWREVTLQGTVAETQPVGAAQVGLQFGATTGAVEVTALKLVDAGAAPVGDLPAEQRPANPLGLIPFALPWDDASASVTNVSAWLDKPAGARGFVTARDGHLYTGDRRIRFFATNITASDCFPTHAKAEKVAGRLAKFGINCVRFHHMDAGWANPSLMAADKRGLNPTSLERLDYFVNQLKLRGIYSDLNLHVSRDYPGAPRWTGMPDFCKGLDNFYPDMVELQREYARELLGHVNAYTGQRYAEEPAVAFVEINNENGLISQWSWNALDAMAHPYVDELARQWNAWLATRYPDEAALRRAWLGAQVPLGAELLTNRDFAKGAEGWTLETQGAAKATAAAAPGPDGLPGLRLTVQTPGEQGWHCQFHQAGLKVAKGQIYTLSFRARASAKRSIAVDCRQAHEPWHGFWETTAALTPQWQSFRFAVSPSDSDDNARITLGNLGAAAGTVELADVSFRPGGGHQPRPGDALGHVAIVTKAEVTGLPPTTQADWTRFLYETEEHYWTGMARFLKDELGVKAAIFGTAAGFSPVTIQGQLDLVDGHAYWEHPSFPGQPWDSNNWRIHNKPMAGVADGGNLTTLANSRVAGKPFVVTEYDHPAPNTYNSEAFLLLAAYGALQDWDGIFSFCYDTSEEARISGFFSVDSHPGQMATMPVAAALFLRPDVTPPGPPAVVSATREAAIGRVRQAGPWFGADAFGLPHLLGLVQPVALNLGAPDGKRDYAGPVGLPVVSRNRELSWDQGVVTVNTPRTRAVIGAIAKAPFVLGDVTIAPRPNLQNWAAITVTAMDGASLAAPGRILITATGYAENTAMGWKNAEKSTVGREWGRAPSLVEGLPATVTLPAPAARCQAWALDERGQRRDPLALRDEAGHAVLDLGPQAKTLWYEVVVAP